MKDARADGMRWLDQAGHDLDAARTLAAGDHCAQACFLCQQVAEKALKGFLYAAGADDVIGHSVAALCVEVAGLLPDIGARCRTWASLDQYYIPTRYPDALPGVVPSDVFTAEQSGAAIALAEEVLDAMRDHVGGLPR